MTPPELSALTAAAPATGQPGLATTWFCLLAVLWTGFLVLEGFDFGVGALAGLVGRDDVGRRAATSTIGPLWDANEVWLVLVAAVTFAAFPGWYATMFSAFYPVVLLLLVALVLRGVAFEFRDGHGDGRAGDPARWRRGWDASTAAAGVAAPFAVGLLLGNLLSGVPLDPAGEFAGDLGDLLHGYPLYAGLTLVVLCLLHGAMFLALKTAGALRVRAVAVARPLAPTGLAVLVGFVVWTQLTVDGDGWLALPQAVGLVAAAAAVVLRGRADGYAFGATTLALGSVPVAIFVALHPRVMVSSRDVATDLTVATTVASSYSLAVTTVVAAVLLPVVVVYQVWTYHVFRRRTSRADVPATRSGKEPT